MSRSKTNPAGLRHAGLGSPSSRNRNLRLAAPSAATVLGQESKQCIHLLVVRRVVNETALLACQDKISMAQGLEVKRQRIGWDVQTFRKLARREAFRAGLNE